MNPILRNILAVIGGIIIGSVVNMGIVMLGTNLISPPLGADSNDMESIKSAIELYEAKHYIFPFLAHALGTLTGAFIAARFGATRKMVLAMIIGVWFLIGGITTAYMLGTPALPTAVDLVFAYIPMAWIGWRLARRAQ
ncbi:hypothetical protein G3O08_01380 [Cryomorpha ignava]|uniref:Uncharacterized protein n=1 Tax=Cryomorpha ignava TaxID=101383 RepID=A0A7K3WKH8_9FLAO|nr:hypothetical protein [Cryomorpha ignava]NEN22153.1 hypothetical protein [Cryomorpha ignava]